MYADEALNLCCVVLAISCIRKVDDNFRSKSFVAVADHGRNTWQTGQLFRRTLRVAASDENACLRILAVRAANVGAGGAIGFGRHTTGIYDDYFGCGGIPFVEPGEAQAGAYRFAVGTGSAAPEIFDVEFSHGFKCMACVVLTDAPMMAVGCCMT